MSLFIRYVKVNEFKRQCHANPDKFNELNDRITKDYLCHLIGSTIQGLCLSILLVQSIGTPWISIPWLCSIYEINTSLVPWSTLSYTPSSGQSAN
ncbi:MAG: hypothetical protein WC222_10540 [Parachlamydiales bacterium]